MRGLMPRCFEHLFNLTKREAQKKGGKMKTLISCSYLEIYNEKIFDLLDASGSVGIPFFNYRPN
jgi:kinesin family protein 15